MSEFTNKSLERIERLKDNWNNNGASKFNKEHIQFVQHFIDQLDKNYIWRVYPTARDSIQIERETRDEYIEFEIYEDGRIKMFRFVTQENGLGRTKCISK